MVTPSPTYDVRLRDLEAAALRTGRTLTERLDTIERILLTLARAQSIGPDVGPLSGRMGQDVPFSG